MTDKKFNPKYLKKLNNPQRLRYFPPETIVKALNLDNPKNLVDYGAGTGLLTFHIADHYPNARIFALDIEPAMVEEIQHSSDCENVFAIEITDNEMPFADEDIDAVWCITVLHEMQSPDIWLKNVYNKLKPGGKLLIVDWSKKQNTEVKAGPPIDHRIDDSIIISSLENIGYKNIILIDEFRNNYAILAVK